MTKVIRFLFVYRPPESSLSRWPIYKQTRANALAFLLARALPAGKGEKAPRVANPSWQGRGNRSEATKSRWETKSLPRNLCQNPSHKPNQLPRCNLHLKPTHAGTDINSLKIHGRRVEISRELLLHADRRTTATNITGNP